MTCTEFYQIIQTSEYTQAIKSADLITISIGSNELLGLAIKVVSQVTGVPANDPNFAEKAQQVFLDANIIEKTRMLTEMYNIFTSEETKVEIEKAIKAYQENWLKSVQYIKGLNSDVEIVATEFYNPYYEIGLGSYDLCGFVDENIQKLNQILIASSNSEKEYKIAKIYEAFNTTKPRLTNVNVSMSNLNIDPHPNVLGHEVICTKVLDALSSTTASKKDISKLAINEIPDQTYTGEEIKPEVTIKDGNTQLVKDKDYTVSYSDNIKIGEAKVTIMGIGNYTGTVIKTFNIKDVEQKDIANLKISSVESQTYTGIKITPDVEIMDGNNKLIKDTDYLLKYSNNINVGKAKISIQGKGNYKGTVTVEFNIIQNNDIQIKDIAELSITDIEDKIYTGKLITPEVRIKDGENVLIKNRDYTITYSDNMNIGTGRAIIRGIGNYTGKVEKKFEILAKDIKHTLIMDIPNQTYTGAEIKPEVVISSDSIKLKEGQDYTIKYINNIEEGTATIEITGIGNYTGTATKTFNIIKEKSNESNENKEQEKDNTVIDGNIPNAGKKKLIIVAILSASIVSIILAVVCRKYKIIK